MAKTNVPNINTRKTHEGARAVPINAEQELRRSLMACMLWEDTFYESGVEIAERITGLIPHVAADKVAAMAVEAREKSKLRHAPLLVVREMARHKDTKPYVSGTLSRVIQRADELAEFLAIYWKDEKGIKKAPLSGQVKKGLAQAFGKFDAYQLAKYNRDNAVKLRDVLFLSHPKPKDPEQEILWKQLIDDKLPIPDTWETELSAGKDKKATWERLMTEKKLGALALLRNLRNMQQVGVDENIIFTSLDNMRTDRVLPFRFITAARYAPQWESHIEASMLKALAGREKFPGKTVLLIDVSGSMQGKISDKSELACEDAASGLAILARELCENVAVYTFSNSCVRVPDRHGFALRDAISHSQSHGGTYTGAAVQAINEREGYDRIWIITDEQSHDEIPNPKGNGTVINVQSYKNGIGYGAWNHIDGWSENVFDYMLEFEKAGLNTIA